MCKIIGAGLFSSCTMNGMVFKRGAEGEVKRMTNARIAIFTCPFDLTQTETKVGLQNIYVFIITITGHGIDQYSRRAAQL